MLKRYLMAGIVAVLVASGCGREVVVGGQKEVDAVAAGDETSGSSAALAPIRAPAGPVSYTLAVPQGTVTFTGTLSLVAEDGSVAPVADAPRTVTVRLDGREPFAQRRVPAERYVRARVTFTRVEAEVTGGVLGVSGRVEVQLPPGGVVVERAVSMPDPERARETVLVDLNASAWLAAAVGGVVPASVFESAVRVRALP